MELFTHRRENGAYIGDRDVDVLSWMNNFVDVVAAPGNPPVYGLTDLDIDRLTQARDRFVAAFNANAPQHSNRVTVAAKNAARKAVEELCRALAMQIKNDRRIPEEAKLAAGVRPRPFANDDKRTPVRAPHSFPVIQVIAMGPGTHTIRYTDVRLQPSGRKPPGAAMMLLFAEIAPPHLMTGADDALRLIATPTRNPYLMKFEPQHAGMLVRYKARWVTAKGVWGMWGASTLPMVVPLGTAPMAGSNEDEKNVSMKLAA